MRWECPLRVEGWSVGGGLAPQEFVPRGVPCSTLRACDGDAVAAESSTNMACSPLTKVMHLMKENLRSAGKQKS